MADTTGEPTPPTRDEVLTAARYYLDDGLITGYAPFDQIAKLGERPHTDDDAIKRWEAGHGHDFRQKCYPEFQCAAIESHAMAVVKSLLAIIDGDTSAAPRIPFAFL